MTFNLKDYLQSLKFAAFERDLVGFVFIFRYFSARPGLGRLARYLYVNDFPAFFCCGNFSNLRWCRYSKVLKRMTQKYMTWLPELFFQIKSVRCKVECLSVLLFLHFKNLC